MDDLEAAGFAWAVDDCADDLAACTVADQDFFEAGPGAEISLTMEPGGNGVSIDDYCAYGAVSEGQLDGCIDHVEPSEVEVLETNAALYARGELDQCLADAGPFCEDR